MRKSVTVVVLYFSKSDYHVLSFMHDLCYNFILYKMRQILVLLLYVNFLLPCCLLLTWCHQKYLAQIEYRFVFYAGRTELECFGLFHHFQVLWDLLFQHEHLCVYLGFFSNALLNLSTSTRFRLTSWEFIFLSFYCQLHLHTLFSEVLVVWVVSSYLLSSELYQSFNPHGLET